MKKILIALLLIPGFCAGQLDTINRNIKIGYQSLLDTNTGTSSITIGVGVWGGVISSSLSFPQTECKAWEKFTDWQAQNEGDKKCKHVWVNAEWGDVNEIQYTTTPQYCQCGCDKQENEARICAACTRHEKRVRTYGMKEVVKKSEFQTLLEKIHDR